MTIRKLFFLFWTTLAVGTVTAPLAGLAVEGVFGPLGLDLVRRLWAGVMFGAVAQMGFFAYMVFNMVAKGFLRNPAVYQGMQLLLTLVILIQTWMVSGANSGTMQVGAGPWVLPLTIFFVGVVVAWFKARATQSSAFIPALFFMVAATVLEAIPSLEQRSFPMIMLMVLTLLACNAWQIMQLHRLLGSSEPSKQKSQTSRSGS
ncbi:KinB signaling pathway activation protein [Melghirimyces profundicolus]|uniref:KinB signaling pathway activation protein n=1 Tax=Melghirimyces profundicolus TaxID=1242148 RepID=A0A2T6BQ41_9BACL|nr:KinB-signaling pathway activation protein [Melghirimyces profundicolus]PTX58220.1 KinB signaling pathway activation protein [Melghirimyces profundicolus]